MQSLCTSAACRHKFSDINSSPYFAFSQVSSLPKHEILKSQLTSTFASMQSLCTSAACRHKFSDINSSPYFAFSQVSWHRHKKFSNVSSLPHVAFSKINSLPKKEILKNSTLPRSGTNFWKISLLPHFAISQVSSLPRQEILKNQPTTKFAMTKRNSFRADCWEFSQAMRNEMQRTATSFASALQKFSKVSLLPNIL